jgi:hypothetical protein
MRDNGAEVGGSLDVGPAGSPTTPSLVACIVSMFGMQRSLLTAIGPGRSTGW